MRDCIAPRNFPTAAAVSLYTFRIYIYTNSSGRQGFSAVRPEFKKVIDFHIGGGSRLSLVCCVCGCLLFLSILLRERERQSHLFDDSIHARKLMFLVLFNCCFGGWEIIRSSIFVETRGFQGAFAEQ